MSRWRLDVLLMMASLVFTGIALAADEDTTPDPVAEVNGRKISRDQYYYRVERMPGFPGQAEPAEAGIVVLRDLINETLILQLAEQEKCAPTDAQIKERYAEMKRQPGFEAKLRESGMTEAQSTELIRILQAHFNLVTRRITVSPKEVVDYYNQFQETQFTTPENTEVAAIFCEKKVDADKAMALLKKGVKFADVAKQFSSDPISRDRGGLLGRPIYVDDPVVPPQVWKKVLATKEGEYTEPIYDQTGSVIFQVIRHNLKKVKKLPEVRFAIRDVLMREKGAKKWNIDEELNKFREKADIKIMIDRYRDQVLSKDKALPTGDMILGPN